MKKIFILVILALGFLHTSTVWSQYKYKIDYTVSVGNVSLTDPQDGNVSQIFGGPGGLRFNIGKFNNGNYADNFIYNSPTMITSYSSSSVLDGAATSTSPPGCSQGFFNIPFDNINDSSLTTEWDCVSNIRGNFSVQYIQPLDTLNPSPRQATLCEPLQLKVGIASMSYKIVYNIDGSNNYITFPGFEYPQEVTNRGITTRPKYRGTAELDLSLIEGIESIRTILFKVIYSESDVDISDPIEYRINRCGINLDEAFNAPIPNDPVCAGGNGNIELRFERELDSNEKLSIQVKGAEAENIGFEDDIVIEAVDAPSGIYNYQGIPAGYYSVVWALGLNNEGNGDEEDFFAPSDPVNVTLTDPAQISFASVQSNVNCYGANDGIITITAVNGTPPYEYSIENGAIGSFQPGNQFSNLVPRNNYQVVVRDANGCISSPQPAITISEGAEPPSFVFLPESTTTAQDGEGIINVSVFDGTPPYTFEWTIDNQILTPTPSDPLNLTGLNPGSYRLKVTDDNGCISDPLQEPFEILAVPELAVSISTTDQINCEGDTVQLTATATDGSGIGYTYEWFNGAIDSESRIETTNTITTGQGDYSVRVTDSDDNIATATYTINYTNSTNGSTFTTPLSVSINSITNVQCRGENTGAIDITIEGGSEDYEIFWNDTPSTEDLSELVLGSYHYLVRDSNGCEVTNFLNPIIISEPDEGIEVSGTSTNVTVNGDADGTIELTILNGTEPYQFSWWIQEVGGVQEIDGDLYNPYTPTQDINPLLFDGFIAGTYQVLVTDGAANACTAMFSSPIIINQPDPLKINDDIAIVSDVACFGDSTGRIDASYEGTEPFIFVWLDENDNVIQTGAQDFIENLPAGDYSYTVNDASNAGPFNSGNITIAEPTALTASFSQEEVTCFGNDGRITISASGGSAPYRYLVTEGNAIEQPPGSGIFTNLEADNYIINVLDANDCEIPAPLAIELVAPAQITFDDTDAITPITTPNGSDGSISVAIEGGTQPYYYRWTGNGVTTPTNTVNTTTIENLPAGTYTLTVSNNENFSPNDCYLSKSYTITEQDEFSIAPLTGTPTICHDQNNGSITATVEATGLVTYIWRLEDGTEIETILDSNLREITLDNLEDGGYYLEATSENTTITSDIFTIDRLPEITATILTTRTCFGGNTGTILFTDPIGSPSGSFLYSIDNGATTQTTPIFEDLPEGEYFPRLSTEENGNCDFITNEVRILPSPDLFYDEPNTIITKASGPEASDGSISVAVQGGTPPFTYVIDGGTPQDTNVFNDLSEGTYEITITDSVGCVEPAIIEVTAIGPLTISNIVPNDALCRNEANGSITTTVTGEGDIMYSWTLPDGSPVPVSNGINTQNLEGILAGDYVLTVTDDITTVTSEVISVGEPATSLTILDIITTDVSCFDGSDGSIEIQAAGGTGNYTYSINDVDFQPELIFDGLEANNYTVTVRDENLCEFQEPTFVVINTSPELNIAVTEQIPTSAANAFDGAIYITPEGGSYSYTYLWSGPNGFTSNEQDIFNLEAGTYNVIITDANFNINNDAGCQYISEDIIVTKPDQLVATINQTEFIACSGDASAEIVANVQGGVLPYTYQWYEDDNGNDILLDEESDIINNLANGTYFLIATDDNGISTESNRVDITQPNLLVITQNNVTDILCAGESTGAISIRVSGGTPPYQYYWSNNETLPDINGLEAGEYTIEVEDSEGCIATQSIVVASPNEAVVISDATVTDASEYEANDGSIAIDVTGGQEPYTYTWIQSSTNTVISNEATISNLTADTYTVLVSDSYDCEITEEYEISQPDIIEETILQPSCFGNSDGSINLLVNQGNGAFTYLWNTGETENSIDNLSAGSYTVTVTGFQDGPVTRTYIIENPTPLDINLGADRVLCANQSLELDASVDDETVSYSWTSDNGFTSTLPNVEITATGNYTVTLQSQSGCTSQGTIYVDVSTDEINAEFAVSSQVFTRESSVAVDISYPLPDGIEWILPIQATIETQNTDEVEFSFAEAGEYEITLITTRGECIAQKTKKILVVARDGLISKDDDKSGQKLIEDFLVYPNPSDGKFSANVTLTEIGEINIKVFSFANNALIASKRDRGKISYNIPFDLTGLPVGVYAVLLETPYGQTLRKVIIN